MPHDKSTQLLAVGDHVTMEFVIKSITSNEDYCNCSLESVIPIHPGSVPPNNTTISAVNMKQLVKVG
jgi:hypothetical protein